LDVEEDGSHALLTLLFGEAASSIDSDGTEQSRELSNSEEIARFQATEKCREDRPPVSADGRGRRRRIRPGCAGNWPGLGVAAPLVAEPRRPGRRSRMAFEGAAGRRGPGCTRV
jgi:hypothetical protein